MSSQLHPKKRSSQGWGGKIRCEKFEEESFWGKGQDKEIKLGKEAATMKD